MTISVSYSGEFRLDKKREADWLPIAKELVHEDSDGVTEIDEETGGLKIRLGGCYSIGHIDLVDELLNKLAPYLVEGAVVEYECDCERSFQAYGATEEDKKKAESAYALDQIEWQYVPHLIAEDREKLILELRKEVRT